MGKERIPCTPLSYALKHKVGPNELLIDYTGDGKYNRLYMTDANLNIVDITGQIIEQIENADATNCNITVDSVKYNLQDFVSLLSSKIDTSIQMADIGSNITYLMKDNKIDNKSLQIKNKYIQIKGFDTASDRSVLMKSGSGVIWSDSLSSSSTSSSSEDPTDGLSSTNIIEQNIVSSKVYLQASIKQKTTRPSKDFGVVLPDTQDKYCQILWLVITNSNAPNVTFSDNCIWNNLSGAIIKQNSYHLFKFTTYDCGNIWLSESTIYQYSISDITSPI